MRRSTRIVTHRAYTDVAGPGAHTDGVQKWISAAPWRAESNSVRISEAGDCVCSKAKRYEYSYFLLDYEFQDQGSKNKNINYVLNMTKETNVSMQCFLLN